MNDPHHVLFVHPDADRLAQYPVIGKCLRPERVHFEARCLLRLGPGPAFEDGVSGTEREHQQKDGGHP